MGHTRRLLASFVCLCLMLTSGAAAELDDRTREAYDAYVEAARQRFLARVRTGAQIVPDPQHADALREGRPLARPARDGGIISIPRGLVHHWSGSLMVAGATLEQVLSVSQAYTDYHAIYESIIGSRLARREGDTYHLELRVREGVRGITVVLDIRSRVQYFYPSRRFAYALSSTDEIREVRNAGRADEQLLPVGQDSGYLWGASTFTTFTQHDEGVYIELETFGLSRRFPPLLGWIFEPIARRLGRKSVEGSLEEFRKAIVARHQDAASQALAR